jgi:hypothetical protein
MNEAATEQPASGFFDVWNVEGLSLVWFSGHDTITDVSGANVADCLISLHPLDHGRSLCIISGLFASLFYALPSL